MSPDDPVRIMTFPPANEGAPITSPLTPQAMLGMAVARGDTELASKLMDLIERYEAIKSRKAFEAAIADCNFEVVIKNKKMDAGTGRTSYWYEDLAAIQETIGQELHSHGLSYRFRVNSDDPKLVRVTCVIAHREGYSEEHSMCAAPDTSGSKSGVQAIGSTTTYLQRYSLKAALGLAAAVDDDGRGGPTKEASGPVSSDQLDTLKLLCTTVHADEEKFARYMHVASLEVLPASRFEEAIGELKIHGRKHGHC